MYKNMNRENLPLARRTGLVVQDMPDEVLVYDMDTNKAHCLNTTSAMVWRACNGSTSINEIVKQIEKNSNAAVSDDLVWLAIDQLDEKGLLENKVVSRFDGLSRRDVIKKIGFASVVALPVIASLVAPQSAMASSSCVCNTDSDCSGNNTPAACRSGVCNSGVCAAVTPRPASRSTAAR